MGPEFILRLLKAKEQDPGDQIQCQLKSTISVREATGLKIGQEAWIYGYDILFIRMGVPGFGGTVVSYDETELKALTRLQPLVRALYELPSKFGRAGFLSGGLRLLRNGFRVPSQSVRIQSPFVI